MRVYVDETPVDILPGMTARHALVCAGVLEALESGGRVCDEFGNEIGLDGTLNEGQKISVIKKFDKRMQL